MKQSKILSFLEAIEVFLYKDAKLIISVTHSFREILIKKGISDKKIHVITNGVDISNFTPREKDSKLLELYKLNGKFVIGYVGTHGLAHGLTTVIQTAQIIEKNSSYNSYMFIFIGDGASKNELMVQAKRLNLKNIIFIDSVSKSDVVRYWSLLDLSIIHLKRENIFESVIPSKLFEAMSMSIPVLHGVQGESLRIVCKENVGVSFESENPNSLCAAINFLAINKDIYAKLKSNGPKAAKKYARSNLALDMLKIITSIKNEN
jgi:glycosyltransferase involved in cell wall biosynthesis